MHAGHRNHSLVELSSEVQSTSNGLQLLETGDVLEIIVLADGETTVDRGQLGHGEVGQLAVVVENQVTSAGQVGRGELLEGVAEQTELAGQLLERGNRETASIADGDVLSTAEVGQSNLQRRSVGGNVQETSDILQVVDVDGVHGSVGSDVEVTNTVESDTVQAGQTSVGDGDRSGLADTLSERERLEVRQSSPVDRTDGSQRAEAEVGQNDQSLELEGVSDRRELRSRQGGEVGGSVGGETTSDLLDTVQRDTTGGVLSDNDVTLDGRAAAQS